MNNDEFVKHCEGLNDVLGNNEIRGFYFFVNSISKERDNVGSMGAMNIEDLPEAYQNFFILLALLNKPKIDKDIKIVICKTIDMLVKTLSIDLKDIIKDEKGESNG